MYAFKSTKLTKDKNMSHFNEVANEWDTTEKVTMFNNIAQGALKELDLSEVKTVMDFGCGTGLFSLALLESKPDQQFELTGIDTSEGMLAVMQNKQLANVKTHTLNINLEESDLDQKFDLIVSSMAFHHLNDPEKVLIKLSKMLNPGGKIAIVDLETEDGSFHPDNAAMGVKHYGFSRQDLNLWSVESNFKMFDFKIIHTIHKNDKDYPLFLGYFHQV